MKTIRKLENNFKVLNDVDAWAKKHNRLVGRYIKEQIADGYAFYIIVKETKNKVKIELCKNLGDDYCVPYFGDSATIDKAYAKKNIELRDKLTEMFPPIKMPKIPVR